MNLDIDEEIYQRIDDLEAEKHNLAQKVRQLESALDKEKKFHRKFVEDVVESEETRNKDFKKEKKELVEDVKRLIAENRQLTKDSSFYQTAYESLVKEDSQSTSKNVNKAPSSTLKSPSSPTFQTTKHSVSLPTQVQGNAKILSKRTAKLFEDNKKLKLKNTKLTKDNASLRLKVKQLENMNNKIQNQKSQYAADQNELNSLLASITRTNGKTYTSNVLAKLRELSTD